MTDECPPPMKGWVFTFVFLGFVVLLGLVGAGIQNFQENAVIHNTTITVSGKICESPFATQMGIVTDLSGGVYYFPKEDCEKYPYNETVNISYRHINQMGLSDEYDFNSIVGSPRICEKEPAFVDKCNLSSEVVILVSVYRNAITNEPLWTELKVSNDCGNVRHEGYSQNHVLLVSPTEKLKVTVMRVFDPDTDNTTLVKANPAYLYPLEGNDYRIVLSELSEGDQIEKKETGYPL